MLFSQDSLGNCSIVNKHNAVVREPEHFVRVSLSGTDIKQVWGGPGCSWRHAEVGGSWPRQKSWCVRVGGPWCTESELESSEPSAPDTCPSHLFMLCSNHRWKGERKKKSRSDLSLNVIFACSSVSAESVAAQFSTDSTKQTAVEVVPHQKINGPVLSEREKMFSPGEGG